MKTHKVRPVLVENLDKKGIITRWASKLHLIKALHDSGIKTWDIILISLEDEKIEVGDNCLIKDDEIKRILKCSKINHYSGKHILHLFEDNNYQYLPKNCFKVIATQEQLSLELIQQLVAEYNNGGMQDFEIEMEEYPVINGYLGEKKLKLKSINGFIVPVKKEPNFYTEEEVISFLNRFQEDLEMVPSGGLNTKIWFNQNKKK